MFFRLTNGSSTTRKKRARLSRAVRHIKEVNLSFWESILASIAKKFDSILNRPFENKFTWSLFALGSLLITGSSIYGFVTKGKAELISEDYNLVFEFMSGPEIIPTLLGTILVGFSIAIFWKTKISKSAADEKSDFDKLVEAGIDNHQDYIIEKAFKKDKKRFLKNWNKPDNKIIFENLFP